MRDYAELVKALRYCSEHDDCGSQCPYFSSTTVCADERAKDAAVAIEELLAKNNELWIQLHVEGRSLISEPTKEVE